MELMRVYVTIRQILVALQIQIAVYAQYVQELIHQAVATAHAHALILLHNVLMEIQELAHVRHAMLQAVKCA
jgi:hypothetical protein